MNEHTKPLAGKHVTFTGRLASLTRSEAAALVRTQGGRFVPDVSRRTALLIVGQEGWPLRKDGSLSRKLVVGRRLQAAGAALRILTESEFLESLGLEGPRDGVRGRFTLAELGRMLKVPRDRLRAWIRAGLLAPVETLEGVAHFDFQQVAAIRTLWDLTRSGVTLERLTRSLKKLRRWLPALDISAQQLHLLERDGRLLLRLQQGQLVDASGQLHFDFEEGAPTDSLPSSSAKPRDERSESRGPTLPSADSCFDQACDLEAAGKLAEAIDAYRQALYVGGPDAVICFNLGNTLYRAGQMGQAAERFRQAIELDHDFAEAWNNLGNVLMELGDAEHAINAFESAVRLAPDYADAHYNLADGLQAAERFSEARPHWKTYVKLSPMGPWADYARRCLGR